MEQMKDFDAIDAEVRSMLEENERRKNAGGVFDPLTGEGSPGPRFEVTGPDGRRLFLPECMRDTEPAQRLRNGERITAALLDTVRVKHDFPYWAATRAYIKRKGGGEDTLFRLNRPQRRLVEALEAMRTAGRPIRLILLKARQWGGSTCIQLYMAWLQLVIGTGLNSLIVAHQAAATDEIKDMFDRLVIGLREHGRQKLRVENVGKSRSIFRVAERNAKIKVGSAERPDSCRGGDYSLVHCSEVGVWKATPGKTPEQMIRSACSGVLLQPMTMIVYESTANGTGNFFHREYEAARRGESQFRPLFVAWYEIEQYSLPPEDYGAFARMLIEGRASEAATSDRRQPGSYLWWLWQRGATLEAINWYVAERAKYGEHGLMAAEYPSDDVEAFVHSGARVFDKYRVEALREACSAVAETGEIDVPALNGIPFDFGHCTERDLRDALGRVALLPSVSGAWKIWRRPETAPPGAVWRNRYLVAVDVGGRSLKSDWSVIVVFDRMEMTKGGAPEVVAQWRGHTDFDILAWKAAMAARLYGNALLVIESNTLETHDADRRVDGDQSNYLLNRLREVYDNLYARRPSDAEVRSGAPRRYGFHTNTATKPMIVSTLVRVIREGLYVERDEQCLDEYLSYERRSNGSYGAIPGCHDDLLMTRAIGLHICFYEMDIPSLTEAGMKRHRRRPVGYSSW